MCVFSLPIYILVIVRIVDLNIIIINSEIQIIRDCLGLGHEPKLYALYLAMLLCICDMAGLFGRTFHVLVVFALILIPCH